MSNNGKLPFPGYVVNVATGQLQTPQNFVAGNPGTGWRLPLPQELNGLTQQCPTAEVMRGFPAYPGMVCFLQGIASPGDGSGGMFYWSNGTYSDDDLDTIVPTVRPWPFGVGSEGAWLRAAFPGGGTGSVTSIDADAPIVVGPDPITHTGTISHADSGVVADTYGNGSFVPQITVDAKGHLTNVTEIAIAGGEGSMTSLTAGPGLTFTDGAEDGTITTSGTIKNIRFAIEETGSSVTAANTDQARFIRLGGEGGTYNLPAPGTGGGFQNGWFINLKNVNTNAYVTVNLGGSGDGQNALHLSPNQEVQAYSNGTTWSLRRGVTGGLAEDSAIINGYLNQIQSSATRGVIVGGTQNLIDDNGTDQFIVGGTANHSHSDESNNTGIVGGNTNDAQGQNAVVVGGNNNTVNTDSVIAGGDHNQASGNSFVGGGAFNAATAGWGGVVGGKYAYDAGRYGLQMLGGGGGDYNISQVNRTVLRCVTASTSPTRLTWDGQTAAPQTTVALPDNTIAGLNLTLIGRQGTTDAVVLSCIGALITRGVGNASVAIVGSPSFTITSATAGAVGTTATLTADTSNGSADISVTAPNGSAWVWTLLYESVEGR